MSKANYVILFDRPDALVLMDVGPWDRYMTVTNDAEAVVEEVAPELKGRKLLYYDSDGEVCELLVVNGRFTGFGARPA